MIVAYLREYRFALRHWEYVFKTQRSRSTNFGKMLPTECIWLVPGTAEDETCFTL